MTPADTRRAVFFGTPEWAVPSLVALEATDGIDVVAVVTNPDRPAGRGYKLRASPIKERAIELGLDVLQPERVRNAAFSEWFRDARPDVAVVVAYGKILPAELLAVPSFGFVNMHFSLLPAYRGAAPVQHAVMDGARMTGASIMVLTEGMDEGPVLATTEVSIGPTETAGELGARLAEIGAGLLVETLPRYLEGSLQPVLQDDAAATYAPKISSEQARIEWSADAGQIVDKVRALNPSPGAWTTLRGERLKILSLARVDDVPSALAPGEVLVTDRGLYVGTGELALLLGHVQLAGKKPMAGSELARGMRFAEGERLGEDVGL